MKDTAVTIRLPAATRQRLETLARDEGRSLSAQVERLIEQGLLAREATPEPYGARGPRSLAGALSGGLVSELTDFRKVRSLLSASLAMLQPKKLSPSSRSTSNRLSSLPRSSVGAIPWIG